MPSGDEIRDVQRATWAGLSAGWEKWDSVIMDQLGPVGAAIIERLDIAEDQQHLDIAAGTGEPGLSIARLSPKGRVVLTDLVAEMLDIAARRARAQGIANVEMLLIFSDVETLDHRCADRAQLLHDDRVPLLPARREPGPRLSLNVSDLIGARHRPSPIDASTEHDHRRIARTSVRRWR